MVKKAVIMKGDGIGPEVGGLGGGAAFAER